MISIALYSWKPSECLTQLKMAGFSGLLLCFLCDTAVFMCHIVSAKFYRMLIGRWGEKEKDFQWWWREVLNSVNLWKQFRNPRVLRLDLRTSGQYPGNPCPLSESNCHTWEQEGFVIQSTSIRSWISASIFSRET